MKLHKYWQKSKFSLGLLTAFVLSFLSLLFSKTVVWAQTAVSLDGEATAIQEATGLSDAPLSVIIGNIINIVLGLLGIVLVGFIIYAGILWMTAGDSDQVDKAKKVLKNSVIGLTIVLMSWAIASFVISSLNSAVTDDGAYSGAGSGGGLGGGAGSGGGGFGGDEGSEVFQVVDVIPEGEIAIRNVKVKIYFNQSVDVSTITEDNIFVSNEGENVAGDLNQVHSRLVEFIPSEYCPEPHDIYHCFSANSDFTVFVSQDISNMEEETLYEDYTVDFSTGDIIDVDNPSISILEPNNNQSVSIEDAIGLQAQYSDDGGVSVVEFYADDELVGDPIIFSPAELTGSAFTLWSTVGIDPLQFVGLQAKAFDLADNSSQSPMVNVYTRPEHCFNNNLDEDLGETDIDCGGDCGACSGDTCVEDTDCSSGLCLEGSCQIPVKITQITPEVSASGNIMTIKGLNFGEYDAELSKVSFNSQVDGQEFEANLACSLQNWYDDHIVVEVPDFAEFNDGDLFVVEVTTAYDCGGELCSDNTVNNIGWHGYFEYDSTLNLPGLCDISPKSGYSKTEFALQGLNLGGSGEVYAGNYLVDHNGSWGETYIDSLLLPYLEAGKVPVRALTNAGDYTNPLYFEVLFNEDIPMISNVVPDNGAPQQYISIQGENFGNDIANVWFSSNITGQVAADTSFPAECMDSWWSNNNLIVKVPDIPVGEYNLLVETTSGESNNYVFTVNNRDVTAGICKVDPESGPPSTEVALYGDNFSNTEQTVKLSAVDINNIEDWSNQEISLLVPEIESGEHLFRIIDDAGNYSNNYPFNVQYCNDDTQCSEGKVCCFDGTCRESCEDEVAGSAFFQWKFSTGKIPFIPKVIESKDCVTNLRSPSPWMNSDYACVNAVVSARFNTEMTELSLNEAVSVYDCNDDEECSCFEAGDCEEVAGTLTVVDTSEVDEDDNTHNMNGFIFKPSSYFTPSNFYKVVITEQATSEYGNNLPQDYSWQFQIRDNSDLCTIERVQILPLLKTLIPADLETFNTLLTGEQCMLLNPDDYTFVWDLNSNLGPAEAGYVELVDEEFDSEKEILALAETPEDNPVRLGVTVEDTGTIYNNDEDARIFVKEGEADLAVKHISNCMNSYTSPSPYLNQTDVCINSLFSAQFTKEVDPTTLTTDNINFKQCSGEKGAEDFECVDDVSANINSSFLRNENNEIIGFVATPDSNLNSDTWYKGILSGGELGIEGSAMVEGKIKEVYLNDDYEWYFKTGNEECELSEIKIQPQTAFIKEPMGEQKYVTYPLAENCNIINVSTKNWDWVVSKPSYADLLLTNSPLQTVIGLKDNGDEVIDVMATVEGVSDKSELYVRFTNPNFVDHYPECNSACINSAVGVEFDQSIATDTLNMELYECANESCLEYNSTLVSEAWLASGNGKDITPGDKKMFIIDFASNLESYTFYKVIVTDVFGHKTRKPVDNYNTDSDNDGEVDSYTWRFKTGEHLCEIESVNLSPLSKYSNTVGEKQDYLAMPISAPNECSAQGSYLNPYDFNWDWQSSDNNRVSLSDVEVNLNLPSYCSSNCLRLGSKPGVAVCGNGVVETGEDCDSKDGCSSNCLWEGTSPSTCGNGFIDAGEACDIGISTVGCTENCLLTGALGAVCGNGKVEDGEACDDGNNFNGDGCSSNCLLEGGSIAENSCGNGIIEKEIGEECDDGNIRDGDGCSSNCLLEGYQNYIVNGEAVCGDGIVQSGIAGEVAGARGEACDDGNNFNGDGCSSNCLWEGGGEDCGDGNRDFGEACDDDNNESGDGCSGSCLLEGSNIVQPSCGNGIVETGEACDDGDIYDGDGCSSECLWEGIDYTGSACGNGDLDYGEACDYLNNEYCNTNCQLIGGSLATESVCGNGEIGEGEACDDGNRFNGDGCSSICLNEGTTPSTEQAVCGNGVVETGEDCDDGNIENGDGCSNICLWEGTDSSLCGNDVVDDGEDCDDDNRIDGDGCSSICLNEGSSYKYNSVCGNGIIERGEECETSVLAVKKSPYQWATIEDFISDPDSKNTSTADITAKEIESQISGKAKIILECSFTEDNQCPDGSIDYGVGNNQCCYKRPVIIDHLPLVGETQVCRNPQIQVMFDNVIDEATLSNGIEFLQVVADDDSTVDCEPSENYSSSEADEYFCEFDDWVGELKYVEVEVDDETELHTLVNIKLRDVLDPVSEYYLVYNDELTEIHNVSLKHETTALTILDDEGNAIEADVYNFTTAEEICELSEIVLINVDNTDSHPFSLLLPERAKTYQALTYDNQGRFIAAIEDVYDWSWQWLINPTDIAAMDVQLNAVGDASDYVLLSPIHNGLANLSVTANVETNLNAYACANDNECNSGVCKADGYCKEEVSANQNIDVFVCANPWPTDRLYINDMFNFGLRYCRDTTPSKMCYGGTRIGQNCNTNEDCPNLAETGFVACAKDIASDIPKLHLSKVIPPSIVTESTGLLREYLFNVVKEKTYCYDENLEVELDEDSNKRVCAGDLSTAECMNLGGNCLVLPNNELKVTGDVIGVRVFLNPDHLDVRTWYEENMYNASQTVEEMDVDGYGALRVGKNYYVHAANLVPGTDGYDFYTNIYLFTFSNDADAVTGEIFSDILDSLYFNMNLYDTQTYSNWQDWHSNVYTNKQKIIRDVTRLEDLQKIDKTLENIKDTQGSYPTLTAGTLLPGVSYSTWPSWQSQVGLSIVDPINEFSPEACPYSVGECVDSLGNTTGTLCATDVNCDTENGETCVETLEHLYNQKTCYNSSTQSLDEDKIYFSKPDSYVYRYESIDNGARYLFDYNMEYLEHMMISEEGDMSGTSIMGSAGKCHEDGQWFEEGESHPDELFTTCHFGRWVSSCGNGIVEPEFGEECESSVDMCSEAFGDEAWYDPQIKYCSDCQWLGMCSGDRDRSCFTNDDCKVGEFMSCEEHPILNGIKTCQGIGSNVGKLCDQEEDCRTYGNCLEFREVYAEPYGKCLLENNTGAESGAEYQTNTFCNLEDQDCEDYYSEFYCQHDIGKVCALFGEDGIAKAANECEVDADCVEEEFTCQDKYMCYNVETEVYEYTDQDRLCSSNADCDTDNGFTCEGLPATDSTGTCYTQFDSPTSSEYECKVDADCDIKTKCNITSTTSEFSEEACGGYCGDGVIQSENESCDWAHEDYSNTDEVDSTKPYCSYTCRSSCPSGENGEVFYQGDSYFLRKYCVGGSNDGNACSDNSDCADDGVCQVDTFYDITFAAQDGIPSGLNLYLPACKRLAQGQWQCESTDPDYNKQGAWCNSDYPAHCVDDNGIVGECVEQSSGYEPASFTVDIELNDLAAPTSHILFILDKSGSMGTMDVSCEDPWNDNDYYWNDNDYYCGDGQLGLRFCTESAEGDIIPHEDCSFYGFDECFKYTADSRLECAVDALANESNGGIKQLVDLNDEDLSFSALRFSGYDSSDLYNNVSPTLEDFNWYNKDNYSGLIDELPTWVGGSTYTHLAFERALEVFNNIPDTGRIDQKIIILLTDGDAEEPDLTIEQANALKEAGIKIFTITYPNAVANSDLWSSECPVDSSLTEPEYPPCNSEPQYSYQGVGIDDSLPEIYAEIINTLQANLTIGTASQQLYTGRYIPLPGEYHCASEAQLLPVDINLSSALTGEVEISNLRFNYCP